MTKSFLVVCLVAASVLFLESNGEAASMFNKKPEEVVISSPFAGHIMLNGKPAVGAKVVRHLAWRDEKGEDEITEVDESGYFAFPIKTDLVTVSKITTFVINQQLRVEYQGQEYLIWTMGKGSKNLYGELGGKPQNFVCELSDDLERVEVDDGLLGTSCKWSSIEPE